MSATDWREKKREETFEGTLKGLRNRRSVDSAFSLQDARSSLKDLYILEGNDWLGRGELGDIVTSATIAAYELFIHEWEKELSGPASEAAPKGV
jgi:hypothetical protein